MTILIDQDNTIADFLGGFQKLWQMKYPKEIFIPTKQYTSYRITEQYPPELKEKIESIYTSPGFILGLEPIKGSIEAISEMANEGHEVYVCTSPLSSYEHCVIEKYQWVDKYLGRNFTKKIILTKNKALVRGDFFIDDNPLPRGSLAPMWKHIIFDQPYNKDIAGKRLRRWEDWREVLV